MMAEKVIPKLKKCFGLECGNWLLVKDEDGKVSIEGEKKQKECFECPLFDRCVLITAIQRENIMVDLLLTITEFVDRAVKPIQPKDGFFKEDT
jgi:hypothetical protein